MSFTMEEIRRLLLHAIIIQWGISITAYKQKVVRDVDIMLAMCV